MLVLADGTAAVTGVGGPNLPGGFIQGVTAGYGPDGTLRWEAFARMATVWATALPGGGLCATGGFDALVTCWREGATPPPAPNKPPQASFTTTSVTGFAPLTVGFDGSRSSRPRRDGGRVGMVVRRRRLRHGRGDDARLRDVRGRTRRR